ncbi:MAG: glutathione peroxidase [Bacteroidetes bacterium]|nr:glutathione peroxidase [Bacteroidota bacterium]
MTTKQKIIKALYPAILWASQLKNKSKRMQVNQKKIVPISSIYDLSVNLNNGDTILLENLKGKKILFVNTASECGFTPQYDGLEALSNEYKEKLIIIGFPANDFGEQEKGTDQQIAAFCKLNFGVSFPLAKKSSVIKSAEQNSIFKWLSDESLNGWNQQAPTWNFCKYLVSERGELMGFFDSSVSPNSEEIKNAINN